MNKEVGEAIGMTAGLGLAGVALLGIKTGAEIAFGAATVAAGLTIALPWFGVGAICGFALSLPKLIGSLTTPPKAA